MQRESTIAAPPAPPGAGTAPGSERTAASGWGLRAVATVHVAAAFAQPVFAGVFLSGDYDGIAWHRLGADVVFTIGLLQLAAAAAVWLRVRRAWPFWLSLALVAAETAQYLAGMDGALWLHLPLGVAVIAALAVGFIAVWMRPLPRRRKEVRADA
jgi:hypothetical protein